VAHLFSTTTELEILENPNQQSNLQLSELKNLVEKMDKFQANLKLQVDQQFLFVKNELENMKLNFVNVVNNDCVEKKALVVEVKMLKNILSGLIGDVENLWNKFEKFVADRLFVAMKLKDNDLCLVCSRGVSKNGLN